MDYFKMEEELYRKLRIEAKKRGRFEKVHLGVIVFVGVMVSLRGASIVSEFEHEIKSALGKSIYTASSIMAIIIGFVFIAWAFNKAEIWFKRHEKLEEETILLEISKYRKLREEAKENDKTEG